MTSHPGPLSLMVPDGFEEVAFGFDADTGLRTIVALHSTVLGPGLGGTRFWPYPDEGAALLDVCRLARGMTYKHAAAGLDQGGGKGVILGDPRTLRSDALIVAYGRFVDGLGGRYITAEDVGTTQADMDLIRTVTPYVTGVSEALGGSGDPSPATALGVLCAMQAVATRLWDDPSLTGKHVCISGVGKVGAALADHLHAEGARLTIADVRADATAAVAARTGAVVVGPAEAHAVVCDIFAPCALGASLDATTIGQLACVAVVGSANNQLATEADAVRIQQSGVLYAPDYVVNAGGVINIAEEHRGYDHARAEERIRRIYDTVLRVLDLADSEGLTTADAADRYAEQRLEAARSAGSVPAPAP
ncbi:MAG: Glu/Leu/Phe/Val dehydrogenase dimerization domain-containing protein [Acidimicrobiales bacterium]